MSTRVLTAAIVAATLVAAGPAQARETRAALDPALVEGRGASVAFAEQEAENARHTGELLSASATGDIASYDPDRRGDEQRAAYTLTGVQILDSDFLDVSYNAIQAVSEFGVKDQYGIENVTVKDVRVDGAGTNVLNFRAFGDATVENLDARNVGQRFINNCGSFNFPPTGPEFQVTLVDGNDGGWYDWGTWCDDRPAPVEPPEPSPWQQP